MNSNLDLIVSATALFQALDLTPLPLADHHILTSLSDLQEVVAYSMQHCAGIERFFKDKQVFQQTVEAAKTVPHTVSDHAIIEMPKVLCYSALPIMIYMP